MPDRSYKRKYLRVKTENLLAEMSIDSVDSRKVRSGYSMVTVQDIGSGGLRFVSALDIPLQRDILLRFVLKNPPHTVCTYGSILRKERLKDGRFQYGVQFTRKDEGAHSQLLAFLGSLKLAQSYLKDFF